MATIAADGSLRDIWQLIIRHIRGGARVTITQEFAEYDRMMHSRTNAMNRWLGMCKPSSKGVLIHTVYINYMIYANPEADRELIIEACNLKAKRAKWRPSASTGLTGESKHRIVTELLARGIRRDKKERMMYITLPDTIGELPKTSQPTHAVAWTKLGGHLGSEVGIKTPEKGI